MDDQPATGTPPLQKQEGGRAGAETGMCGAVGMSEGDAGILPADFSCSAKLVRFSAESESIGEGLGRKV